MIKKLAAVMFGLSLLVGAASANWSDDHGKKKEDKKHDDHGKDKKKH